ncbi:MAG: hypothetical protein WBG82_10035 [Parvibaculum sp.]|uniref:trypsin-like serine peptidase n=1 Tax=Parvibaculum sp. TaxID=2024848 RepID=UPI003C748227
MKLSGEKHLLMWIAAASLVLALTPVHFARANVFGKDYRRLLTDADNLSAVGLIACEGSTRRPTATLVAPHGSHHRDIIITVAHAFLTSDDKRLSHCQFWPGGHQTDAIPVAITLLGTARPDTDWNEDWAVALLEHKAPLKYQPLEPLIMYPEDADARRASGTKFMLAGHNGEIGPLMVSDHCGPRHKMNADINRFDSRAFNHDCGMAPGWSGGPLMVILNGRPFVIAVNATELNALVTQIGDAYNGVYNANTAVRIDGPFFDAITRLARSGALDMALTGKTLCQVWRPDSAGSKHC